MEAKAERPSVTTLTPASRASASPNDVHDRVARALLVDRAGLAFADGLDRHGFQHQDVALAEINRGCGGAAGRDVDGDGFRFAADVAHLELLRSGWNIREAKTAVARRGGDECGADDVDFGADQVTAGGLVGDHAAD
jgi:hypothetical protein